MTWATRFIAKIEIAHDTSPSSQSTQSYIPEVEQQKPLKKKGWDFWGAF